jgi:hypothetical protein
MHIRRTTCTVIATVVLDWPWEGWIEWESFYTALPGDAVVS